MNSWAREKRPISPKYSYLIAVAVAEAHSSRADADHRNYLNVIANLGSDSARTLMLAMLTKEVEVRVDAMRKLTNRPS